MFSLVVHDDAKEDIAELWRRATKVAAYVTVFLEQAGGDQDLLDRLTQRHYCDDQVNVDHFQEQWLQNRNLWRLKFAPLDDSGYHYRVVYAFHPTDQRYFILGVLHRDFDYRAEDERTRRILAAYNELNIPEY